MRRRVFIVGILLVTSGVTFAAESPRDYVVAVYKGVGGSRSWDSLFAKAMGRKRPFSKSFDLTLITADARSKKSQEPWLDFDPISNSQDPSIHGLRINIVSETSNTSTISAEFRSAPGPKAPVSQVIYDFVRENNLWALDNIRGGSQNCKECPAWSLQNLAKNAVTRR
jgi:hypothetical protein